MKSFNSASKVQSSSSLLDLALLHGLDTVELALLNQLGLLLNQGSQLFLRVLSLALGFVLPGLIAAFTFLVGAIVTFQLLSLRHECLALRSVMGVVVAIQHTMLGDIGIRASFVIGFLFVVTFLCHGSNFLVTIEVLRHFDAFHELC